MKISNTLATLLHLYAFWATKNEITKIAAYPVPKISFESNFHFLNIISDRLTKPSCALSTRSDLRMLAFCIHVASTEQ